MSGMAATQRDDKSLRGVHTGGQVQDDNYNLNPIMITLF